MSTFKKLVQQSHLYGTAAEVSYILRWLTLRMVSLLMLLASKERRQRERTVIAIGNTMFAPVFSREMYASYESYTSRMHSSLDVYQDLIPQEQWLRGRTILDLGSGLGQYVQLLVDGGASCVTGLEYQESKATWSAARSLSPIIKIVVGSAEAMPFDNNSFDTVFSHTVFEHVDDVGSALKEVARVLRPDGIALISYNFFHHRGGHHLFPYIHFPWAPWIVSEEALCSYWSERLGEDQAAGQMGFYERGARIRSLSEGAEIHLNRLTFEDFELLVERVGLQIVKRRSSEELARLFPWLIRMPTLRYFLAGTFYYALAPKSST